ncbi:MAG: hypothetical protein ACFCD0_18620 [Gemmataceae bacterium]
MLRYTDSLRQRLPLANSQWSASELYRFEIASAEVAGKPMNQLGMGNLECSLSEHHWGLDKRQNL